jgi:actin related protein 2/3 complex subunit 1A/1B
LLTASQDRNAYVWNLAEEEQKGKKVWEWKPTLVILRFNRAATCCRWSKDENKFAIGSGAKVIAVCHFDKDNNWWVSKMIKKAKPHTSTVLSIDWHPKDNLWLASGCCDFKARTFSTWIKGVDAKDQKSDFAQQKGDWESKGWVHDVRWSPSGQSVAFVGHDSTLYVTDASQPNSVQTVATPFSPFKKLLWLSENAIVAAGHDFTPVVFSNKQGSWKCYGRAEAEGEKKTETKRGGLQGSSDQSGSTGPSTRHKNTIMCLGAWKAQDGVVTDFCTSSLDGKVLFWKVSDIEKIAQGFSV